MNTISPHIVASVRICSLSSFLLFCSLLICCLSVTEAPWAQVTTSITPTNGTGNLGTTITPTGPLYNITGGTRAETNLFHSFGNFSVGATDTANFLNTPVNGSLPLTTNILGRVTGGNVSNIFGTIQTTGFGNANLFLMNPTGFLFGPNATVNVGGMVAFTSADYLKLTDNARFNAIPNAAADALLTATPVAAFGFLGSNPSAIAVQGSQLTVANGTGLSLVGGNRGFTYTDPDTGTTASVPDGVTMTGGRLSAPSGQINIASVASAGEISAGDFMPTSDMTMGNIALSQGAILNVSGDGGGTVRIRGGEFVITESTISANTINANGAPLAIDINLTGNLSILNNSAPALTARTSSTGDAGEIKIISGSFTATSSPDGAQLFSLIESPTSSAGEAGNIRLTTGALSVTIDPSAPIFFIDSGTGGSGNGGNVTIEAGSATFSSTGINTGDTLLGGSGSAGNLSFNSETLTLRNATFSADSLNARGGDVTLEARDIALTDSSFIDVLSLEGSSTVHVTADHLVMDDLSSILNQTILGPGGESTITAKTVALTNSSTITSQTFGDGDAGTIRVTATEHITLSDDAPSGFNSQSSGIFTNSLGDPTFGTRGNAGAIDITTPRLEITGGARINSTTQTSGRGGDVTIAASDKVTISGDRASDVASEQFGIGGTRASGIYTRTVGSELCSGSCGNAGAVNITTGSLTLQNGGVIDSGTTNNGHGGNTTILATDQVLLSGTMTDGTPSGIFSRTIGTDPNSGSGGNITLTAGQSITISEGASVSASSTGPGNTGNIQIYAGNQFAMTNSSVTTEANQSGGGLIKITTNPDGTVQLTNSTISSSVLDGTGGGGSVNIDPQFVILQNSQILAQAVRGPGGNISITTNLLLPDANSVISASSQFGVNGTVTIQSPNAPASGKIQPLGKTPLQATSLLNQHCAALAGGEFSSFTVAGRDSLPTEPGSWLASPLALGPAGFSAGTVTVGGERARVVDPADETTLLSLRQIAPAGFLTQAFAVDWSASCQS